MASETGEKPDAHCWVLASLSGGMTASFTALRNREQANFVGKKKARSVFNMEIWWSQQNFQVETPRRQLENLVCGSGERFGNLKAVD